MTLTAVRAPARTPALSNNHTAIVLNPAAGRGGIRVRIPRIIETFQSRGTTRVYETARAGDEEQVTARAVADGATTIVAIGGDGTCGRIADALMRSRARCRMAVIAAGTGNDFAKTLGVEKLTPDEIANLVLHGRETRIDVGQADGHFFVNSCGFGFDASVLEATKQVQFLKGNAVYVYTALKQLFTYRGVEVAASGAGNVSRGKMLMVTASNGRWLGGAFKIAPNASAKDGRLDVCFIGDSTVMERVRLFAGALRGKHLGLPTVKTASIAELTLTFATRPSMEMDGELRLARSRTVELRCIARALGVLAAPGFPL